MKLDELVNIEQIKEFLKGTQPVVFVMEDSADAAYCWIQSVLVKFCYLTLKKPEKGVVYRYIMRVSGYSRQQTTRLIKQYKQTGVLKRQQKTSRGFAVKYTREDLSLLGKLDELHGTLSGPATKKLCERAYEFFGQVEYQRLAGISVAHLYNLRNSKTYNRQRWNYEKTKPTISTIGKRAKPYPDGRPGFVRVDTVHQGDLDGHKGVYHINAVDEVTQFEVVYTVERISERFLIPNRCRSTIVDADRSSSFQRGTITVTMGREYRRDFGYAYHHVMNRASAEPASRI